MSESEIKLCKEFLQTFSKAKFDAIYPKEMLHIVRLMERFADMVARHEKNLSLAGKSENGQS